MTAGPQLRIQLVHRPPAPRLAYVDQIVGPLPPPDIQFRYAQGVLTEFDVDLVHVVDEDLDTLLGTTGVGTGRVGAALRHAAVLALARNLRKHRIALVRTVLAPPDPSNSSLRPATRAVLDRVTSRFVVLDPAVPTPDPARTQVIEHATFGERFVGYPDGRPSPGTVLVCGADDLDEAAANFIGVFRAADLTGCRLRLVGVVPARLDAAIRSSLARMHGSVSLRDERLSDGAKLQEIDAAELVVVPSVARLRDLQTLMLALTRGKKVLAPAVPAIRALATTVGPSWVHVTDGPPTAADLKIALSSTGAPTAVRPPLDGRELSVVRSLYADLYRDLSGSRRARTQGE